MDNFEEYKNLRDRMVRDQIERRGIKDQRVLAALREVPRHLFVPENLQSMAYEDCPLSIGEGQTISQPYIVALMTELLNISGEEKILEIGTGSGYQAAVLGKLAKEVHTVERVEILANSATKVLRKLSIYNVQIHPGDGSVGWGADAPYNGILVTAAANQVPQPVLLNQLADEGRLVIPVGGPDESGLAGMAAKRGAVLSIPASWRLPLSRCGESWDGRSRNGKIPLSGKKGPVWYSKPA